MARLVVVCTTQLHNWKSIQEGGYAWTLTMLGSQTHEQIWCHTWFADPCEGWLAMSSGLVAAQQWYLGGYNETHSPLRGVRFVDATVPVLISAVDKAIQSTPGPRIECMIRQVGQQVDQDILFLSI